MALEKCSRCNGTGWASAFRDSGLPLDTPTMHRPIGVYSCPSCGGKGTIGMSDEQIKELQKIVRNAARRAKRKASR